MFSIDLLLLAKERFPLFALFLFLFLLLLITLIIILKNQKKLSKVFVIWTVIVLSFCIILLSVLTLLLLSFGYNM